MVTETDVANVQETWGKIYEKWTEIHATSFYDKLFTDNEEIASAFAKAGTSTGTALKMQALKFGAIVEEFITNLRDPVALNYKIMGLCATHNTKKITNMDLFEFALNDLVDYIGSQVSFNAAQRKSWGAVNASILQQMSAYFAGL